MANGYDMSDWTVQLQPFGSGGSVRYGKVCLVFGGLTIGNRLQLVDKGSTWPEGADIERMSQAAEQAVRDALAQRG
jgi:hypothetical protein